jgi:hypothetical protein
MIAIPQNSLFFSEMAVAPDSVKWDSETEDYTLIKVR